MFRPNKLMTIQCVLTCPGGIERIIDKIVVSATTDKCLKFNISNLYFPKIIIDRWMKFSRSLEL